MNQIEALETIAQKAKNLLQSIPQSLRECVDINAVVQAVANSERFKLASRMGLSFPGLQEMTAQAFYNRPDNRGKLLVWEGEAPGSMIALCTTDCLDDALDESKSVYQQQEIGSAHEALQAKYRELPTRNRYRVYHNGSDYGLYAYEWEV